MILRLVCLLLASLFPRQEDAAARKALEDLIERGDEAALTARAKDDEIARRALAEVRAHKRFGDAYPRLKLVSYEAKDLPTPRILEEASAALGVSFKNREHDPDVVPRPLKERASVEIHEAYRLQALDAICSAIDAEWDGVGDEIVLDSGALRSPKFHLYYRHFSVSIEDFRERLRRDALGEDKAGAWLWFRIRHDGMCRFVGSGSIRWTEVTDDSGRSLVPQKAHKSVSYDTFSMLSAEAALEVPAADVKKLSRVRGVVPVFFPEGRASAEIALAGDKRELALPNLNLKVEEVSDGFRTIRIAGKVEDLKKPHVLPEVRDVRLKAKDGRLLKAGGRRSGQRDAVVLELQFAPPDGFEASSLLIEYFKEVGELEIPFDFKDVPIR